MATLYLILKLLAVLVLWIAGMAILGWLRSGRRG